MSICFECCVLLGRCLCDELITRTEESYRLLSRCLDKEEVLAHWALLGHMKKRDCKVYFLVCNIKSRFTFTFSDTVCTVILLFLIKFCALFTGCLG